MCLPRFEFSIRWILAAGLSPFCLGCEASGPATTGSILQGVTINVNHPHAAGGTEGHDDLIGGHGWIRFYWMGPSAGEVKVQIDHSRLQVGGRDHGSIESGDTVLIDAMNGIQVTVNDQPRRPEEDGAGKGGRKR